MEADTDSALVVRAQRGDTEAFGGLVQRYMRRAYVQALAIVGSREDALDLSQDAFARAYRARHTIDPDRPFYAWFHQILRRRCLNFLRDSKTRSRLLEADGVWVIARERPADPAAEFVQAEVRQRVARAIEQLPPHEREVVVLKEFEELKYREIAALLEIPVGTVMSRLYSARRRLADVLEEQR